MDRDTAVERIASRLGNRANVFNDTIIAEMTAKQTELEHMPQLPWFLLAKNSSKSTTAGDNTIIVPSDFLMEDGDAEQWVKDSSGGYNRMKKLPYGILRGSSRFGPNTETGLPAYYALQEDTMFLFPTPNANYSLELRYYAADTVLTTNVENQWLKHAHDVLIAETGFEMAKFLRDEAAIAYFGEARARAMERMVKQDEARRQANLDTYIGG